MNSKEITEEAVNAMKILKCIVQKIEPIHAKQKQIATLLCKVIDKINNAYANGEYQIIESYEKKFIELQELFNTLEVASEKTFSFIDSITDK